MNEKVKSFFQKDKVKAIIFGVVLELGSVIVASFAPESMDNFIYGLMAFIATSVLGFMKFHSDVDKKSIELKIAEVESKSKE